MKSLRVPYAFLMRNSLGLIRSPLLCVAMQPAIAKEAEMLAVIFIVSCLAVFGFYVYVLVHLRPEEKREDAHNKRLPNIFTKWDPTFTRTTPRIARIQIF
jgi:hypothetical protein